MIYDCVCRCSHVEQVNDDPWLWLLSFTGRGNEAAEDLVQHGGVAADQEDHDQPGALRGPQGGPQASAGGQSITIVMKTMLTLTDVVMMRMLTLTDTSTIPASAGDQSIVTVMTRMLTLTDVVMMRMLTLTHASTIPASAGQSVIAGMALVSVSVNILIFSMSVRVDILVYHSIDEDVNTH